MLSLITPKFKDQVGLYRDDCLAVCKATPREIEKTKQEVSNVFKSHGVKITIEANKKTVNFLDVTNLGKKFLGIIDKCFPPNHPLHKIFNRHTLKLSYSCMPNMKTIISTHNKKILSQDTATPGPTQQQERTCNCRKKPECPLEGKCLQPNVVYQASVTTEATNESYVGLASNFKDRYRNHMTSFRHANRRNETELSKYIWTLKDARKPFRVQWKVLATCKPYDNMTKKCNLCL